MNDVAVSQLFFFSFFFLSFSSRHIGVGPITLFTSRHINVLITHGLEFIITRYRYVL